MISRIIIVPSFLPGHPLVATVEWGGDTGGSGGTGGGGGRAGGPGPETPHGEGSGVRKASEDTPLHRPTAKKKICAVVKFCAICSTCA